MKHKPEYQQQIENLKSGTIAEKRMALDSLSTSKHNIVPALESVILSAEDKYLGWTLEGYDWERGEGKKYDFKLIEDTIQYDCWYVFAVTYLLVGFREASIDTLIPLLTDERPIIRSWVALVLGEIGDERAIPPLLERLTSPDHRELWCVCEALGKLRAIEAVEPLIGLLGMGVVGVEGAAAHALGKIGDLRALMPLIEQLKQQKPSVYSVSAALYLFGEHAIIPLTEVLFDADASKVHDVALMELGMLKDQRAITPILKYLDDDLDTKPVGAAILALGRLKAEQAVLRIAEIYHTATNTNLWRCCSRALAEIGNQQAFATLVYELEHGTPEKQHDAALAFGNMETVENIEPLLAALKNSETNVRRAIVISLGNLRDSRAIPALTEALDDPDEQIREYVLNALDKIREANES